MSYSISPPHIYFTKVPTRQYDPNLSNSYIVGRRVTISATSGNTVDEYDLPFSGSLIKLGLHMSNFVDGDYWNLSGSVVGQFFDTIYTKTVPESFVLEIGRYCDSGSALYFNFYNSSAAAKTIWIDYYFIN